MIKEANFHCEYAIFERAINLIKEYYMVKGYKVENKRVGNDVAFLFLLLRVYFIDNNPRQASRFPILP